MNWVDIFLDSFIFSLNQTSLNFLPVKRYPKSSWVSLSQNSPYILFLILERDAITRIQTFQLIEQLRLHIFLVMLNKILRFLVLFFYLIGCIFSFNQELQSLRVAKVTGGAASKLAKMWVFCFAATLCTVEGIIRKLPFMHSHS